MLMFYHVMPYYGLFWKRSPYLDLRWRSRKYWHETRATYNINSTASKQEQVSGGSPVEIMFIVLWSDISQVLRTREISLYKTIHMISTGDPPFTCSCYTIIAYHLCLYLPLIRHTHYNLCIHPWYFNRFIGSFIDEWV